MNWANTRLLLTGASGGIGTAFATALHKRGASLLLVDIDYDALEKVATALGPAARVELMRADLTDPSGRTTLISRAATWRTNVIINNAGICRFGWLADQTDHDVAATLAINTEAPLALCLGLLPHLMQQPEAHIVNLGSVFGSIGYPGYAVYSASKFAIRGFTEALRRELVDTSVAVHYLAPRATRTGINNDTVVRMNRALGVAMDTPEMVAEALCRLLDNNEKQRTVGFPEKLFVRLNGLIPGVVDRALRKQLPIIKRHARFGTSREHTTNMKEMTS